MTNQTSGRVRRALIIGATGAIGQAIAQELKPSHEVVCLSRSSEPALDFADLDSIALASQAIEERYGAHAFDLIIDCAGILHTPEWLPEKQLKDLNWPQMQETFLVNTLGPALIMKYFTSHLAKEHAVMAFLSAKVGSISDNRLGGWYSYRASKAALNMLIKTAAIELKRTQANTAIVAMHPGTVKSRLSRPFRGDEIGRDPKIAATEILQVLSRVTAMQSGQFLAYDGTELPW